MESSNHGGSDRLAEAIEALRGKRILVTGAAGFIGGDLFRRLAGYDLDVLGTVLHPHEAEALRAQGYDAEVLDLASTEPLDRFVEGRDLVFHVAACFQEYEHSEDHYDRVNNRAARELAEAAARNGVERFVHCSTVGVHGHVKEIPAKETTPFNPMDLYHRTKLAGELSVLEFARSLPDDGMIVTVNRPAMVYGPGDTRMLKLFQRILDRSFRMIGSGEVLGHLGYISDQTDSFLLQATAPREAVHCEAFNIASKDPMTLNDLAKTIAEEGNVELRRLKIPVTPVWLAGWACEILWAPFNASPPLFRRRVGFFTHNRAFDLTKAQTRLGYDLGTPHRLGIRETIAWYREQGMV